MNRLRGALGIKITELGDGSAMERERERGVEGDARTCGVFNTDSDGAIHGPGEHWGGSDWRRVIITLVFEHIKFKATLK